MTSRRCVVLSGTGRFTDPWHPFEETTTALVELIDAAGYDSSVAVDVDAELESLAALPDLLVVNLGLPRDGLAVPSQAARRGLRRYLRSGKPLLGVHVSSTSFTDEPEWEDALGGRWERGVTMHPDQGDARIHVVDHYITQGISDFTVNDERYTRLRVSPEIQVLATHDHDGVEHPIVWLREADDVHGRAAYDALGHDGRSFQSSEHRELLRRIIAWLGDQKAG